MKLDNVYINEAKRIRKDYFESLIHVIKKEEEIQVYIDKIKNIGEIMNNSDNENDGFYKKELEKVDKNINKINQYIKPYVERIKSLDNDQRKLYNSIKEKYPDLTDEEIQNQIVPHILPIDEKIRMKNKEILDKISNEDRN